MKKILSLRLRKCSDVNFELPYFEVVDDKGEVIMDVSESNDSERLILFHAGCEGKILSSGLLIQMVEEAGRLIDLEKN